MAVISLLGFFIMGGAHQAGTLSHLADATVP